MKLFIYLAQQFDMLSARHAVEFFSNVFYFILYDFTVGKKKLQICCLESSNGVMVSCPSTGMGLVHLLNCLFTFA